MRALPLAPTLLAVVAVLSACDSGHPLDPAIDPVDIEHRTLAVGERHGCALSGGKAYCWGSGEAGQTGGHSTVAPTAVAGDLSFVSITAGSNHTCALDGSGSAYCWGNNSYGKLGVGGTATSVTPASVAGGHRFTSLSAGPLHTCGITARGDAYCWGLNAVGALGSGDTENHYTPIRVAGTHRWKTIGVGLDHTCALDTAGHAYCWGLQTLGLLGNGKDANISATPSPVSGGLTFARIAVGANVACGTTAAGEVHCWGTNVRGELGRGNVGGYSSVPVPVSGVRMRELSVGGHLCGLPVDGGGALCWGSNEVRQTGNDSGGAPVPTPTAMGGGLTLAHVTAGIAGYSCGLTPGGALYCWGIFYDGTLLGHPPVLLPGGRSFDV